MQHIIQRSDELKTIWATDTDLKRVINIIKESYAVGPYYSCKDYEFKLRCAPVSAERLSPTKGSISLYPENYFSKDPNAQECDATGAQ